MVSQQSLRGNQWRGVDGDDVVLRATAELCEPGIVPDRRLQLDSAARPLICCALGAVEAHRQLRAVQDAAHALLLLLLPHATVRLDFDEVMEKAMAAMVRRPEDAGVQVRIRAQFGARTRRGSKSMVFACGMSRWLIS